MNVSVPCSELPVAARPRSDHVREASRASFERPFVILGARGDPRVAGFQDALARANLGAARLIDYRDVHARPGNLAQHLPPGAVLRIESPGRDAEVTRALLAAGVSPCRAEGEPFVTADELAALAPERGRIIEPRQAYRGLCALLDHVSVALSGRPDVTSLLDPALIKLAFDKRLCHAVLSAMDVSVPRALPSPAAFDDLVANMRTAHMPRVFAKLRHGSAASGMVALAASPRGLIAWTTTEMARTQGCVRLFNTRRVRRLDGAADVSALVDALIPLGVHVEAWVPKAGIDGATCDLRVLVVDSEPAHMVLRKSSTPFTNLHLGNERAPAEALKARMSEAAWSELLATCRRVGQRFARSFYVALDIAVAADFKRHYVLEVNAFGDLLHGVHAAGLDPHAFQIARLPGWLARRQPCST